MHDDELWILSYYRVSEIDGALFFGRIARTLGPGPIQIDLTKHFSDEARHAWYWTECIHELGKEPLRLDTAYQDRYAVEAGIPVNLMEVLAVTQVFEQRVIHQYARHQRVPNLHPVVHATLEKIMKDETWHLEWVRKALRVMEEDYGKEAVKAAIDRYREADGRIYAAVLKEHEDRVAALFGPGKGRPS